ncbi:hypothetical protein OAL14_06510 [Gammaproteobacteria bacterium]|nr:hypothetical protein [Gammaproteobacteria bacterium]
MSVDGTWDITTDTPMGAQKGTLSLATDGGTLTGKMSGAQGEIEIEDGTVDGDDISYKFSITSPMAITIEVTASIDGDNISGSAKLGAFGNATITGSRA